MPASALWLEQASPAQWSLGSPTGIDLTLGGAPAPQGAPVNNAAQAYDTTLHFKVAGGIVIALLIVFGAQIMGFRFVTSATVGVGR